jgi:hypothetical protein
VSKVLPLSRTVDRNNRSFGNQAGDHLAKTIGTCLREGTTIGISVARYPISRTIINDVSGRGIPRRFGMKRFTFSPTIVSNTAISEEKKLLQLVDRNNITRINQAANMPLL